MKNINRDTFSQAFLPEVELLFNFMESNTEKLHAKCHDFLVLVKKDYVYLAEFYRERDGVLNDEHIDRWVNRSVNS